jgi:hypothetical protein
MLPPRCARRLQRRVDLGIAEFGHTLHEPGYVLLADALGHLVCLFAVVLENDESVLRAFHEMLRIGIILVAVPLAASAHWPARPMLAPQSVTA